MFEIAISPRSRMVVPLTRYDSIAGRRFSDREQAEQFCHDLNHFCHQQRFLVILVGQTAARALRAAA